MKTGDKQMNLSDQDIFVVPSWTAFGVEADTQIVLFGFF